MYLFSTIQPQIVQQQINQTVHVNHACLPTVTFGIGVPRNTLNTSKSLLLSLLPGNFKIMHCWILLSNKTTKGGSKSRTRLCYTLLFVVGVWYRTFAQQTIGKLPNVMPVLQSLYSVNHNGGMEPMMIMLMMSMKLK